MCPLRGRILFHRRQATPSFFIFICSLFTQELFQNNLNNLACLFRLQLRCQILKYTKYSCDLSPCYRQKILSHLCPTYFFTVPKDALIKSTCADWRADFSSDEARKAQEYFVYFKFFGQSQAEKMPSRRARGFIQRIPSITGAQGRKSVNLSCG